MFSASCRPTPVAVLLNIFTTNFEPVKCCKVKTKNVTMSSGDVLHKNSSLHSSSENEAHNPAGVTVLYDVHFDNFNCAEELNSRNR